MLSQWSAAPWWHLPWRCSAASKPPAVWPNPLPSHTGSPGSSNPHACTIKVIACPRQSQPDEVSEGVSQHWGVRVYADAEGGLLEVVLPPRLHEWQVERVCHLLHWVLTWMEIRKGECSPTGHGWRRRGKRGQRCRPHRLLSAHIVFCWPACKSMNWAQLV